MTYAAYAPHMQSAPTCWRLLRVKFDFPFLLSESLRAGIALVDMAEWVYVDMLDVLRATDHTGECHRLQCAFRSCIGPPSLRAHRALDDCLALGAVVRRISASLRVAPFMLFRCTASSRRAMPVKDPRPSGPSHKNPRSCEL